jgi:hypothetical protein
MPARHELDDGNDRIDGGGGARHRAAAAAAAAASSAKAAAVSRPQPHASSGSRAAVSAGADGADDIDDGHVSDDRYIDNQPPCLWNETLLCARIGFEMLLVSFLQDAFEFPLSLLPPTFNVALAHTHIASTHSFLPLQRTIRS